MQKHKGFTLIEVLIVMLIISIVGSIAILTISKNKTSQIRNVANQLTYIFRLAADQALLQPTVLGATVKDNQIKFYEFAHDPITNKDNWIPTNNKLFALIDLPSDISVTLKNSDDAATSSAEIHPQIIFSSSGEVNAFTLLLGKNSRTPLFQISANSGGTIDEKQL